MINWQEIDSVFLDMDGTLLDLHFDNYFWLEHLPQRYAEIKQVNADLAQQNLLEKFRQEEGSLNWYCVDYWSQNLGVDIRQLKEEIQHKIAFRPHVEHFLASLKHTRHRVVLVTNAHHKSLNLKLAITGLDQYVDNIVCSHDLQKPKEDPSFWEALQSVEPFDPARTLFIDDSLPVLRSAARYGIQHLLTIAQPDSQKPEKPESEFAAIAHFSDLLPSSH